MKLVAYDSTDWEEMKHGNFLEICVWQQHLNQIQVFLHRNWLWSIMHIAKATSTLQKWIYSPWFSFTFFWQRWKCRKYDTYLYTITLTICDERMVIFLSKQNKKHKHTFSQRFCYEKHIHPYYFIIIWMFSFVENEFKLPSPFLLQLQ